MEGGRGCSEDCWPENEAREEQPEKNRFVRACQFLCVSAKEVATKALMDSTRRTITNTEEIKL